MKRSAAQLILFHRHKPLLGRPKDHRILAPPTMRVGMRQLTFTEKQALFFQLLNDVRICFEDILPGEFRHRVSKASLVI